MKRSSYLVPISTQLLDDALPPISVLLSQHRGAPAEPRPVMQAALLFTALRLAADNYLARAVLELHRPGDDLRWPTCQGCDDPEGADWPCSTAELLARHYRLALP